MSDVSDSSLTTMKPTVLIVGCGELGITTAPLLRAQGYHVVGARRSVERLPSDLESLAIDVQDADSLQALAAHPWSAVIVTLTADSFNPVAYEESYVEGLRNVLSALAQQSEPPLVLFASSTSVYGQNDGSWVDEGSETLPAGFSGKTMLRAEALLHDYPGDATAIRFGGIYGRSAGRLVQRLNQGQIYSAAPVLYSNRIHYRDCASIFTHLIQHASTQQLSDCYLAVDHQPTPLHEVMRWLAIRMGLDIQTLEETAASTRGGNKRCRNARLVATGFRFAYPDFTAGFTPLVPASEE